MIIDSYSLIKSQFESELSLFRAINRPNKLIILGPWPIGKFHRYIKYKFVNLATILAIRKTVEQNFDRQNDDSKNFD